MAEAESAAPPPETARHHDKAAIRAFVAIAIVVALGLLLALFAAKLLKGSPGGSGDERQYNGFEFANSGNSWFTRWERDGITYNLEFRHPPWEVENITVQGSVDARFQRPYLFITHDAPDEGSTRHNSFLFLASADITSMLVAVFDRTPVEACTANTTDVCSKLPAATCSTNASVIYLKKSNDTGILLDGNCVTIQGVEENLTRAADKALYQWLGIVR